jgi:hypothetical protein
LQGRGIGHRTLFFVSIFVGGLHGGNSCQIGRCW